LAIQRNYLLQKKRKKKKRDEMMQHRRHMSRNREKMRKGANPSIVSMESSDTTSVQASASFVAANDSAASASAASASASASAIAIAQQQQSNTGAKSQLASSPSPSVAPTFNPGLLHSVSVPSASGDGTTSSASTSRADNGDGTNNNQAHILSPYEVAQRALAAQVEAYNRASTQMGLDVQMQQQAFGFPPAPEAQEALPASVAAAAWQGRIPMSSYHTDDSSESSS
jgi:hypothetical protein